MADLIDRAALLNSFNSIAERWKCEDFHISVIESEIELAPAVDAVELPCKIGDRVWAIRSYKGIKHPQEGIVSEMLFTNDMRLMIVVKNVARGTWGETVFGSYKETDAAIERRTDATD